MQEMVIYGVSFDMVGKQPIVLLKAVDTNKFLPIWIGNQRRVVRGLAARLVVGGQQRAQVERVDEVVHVGRQPVIGHPVMQRRRHEQQRVLVIRAEGLVQHAQLSQLRLHRRRHYRHRLLDELLRALGTWGQLDTFPEPVRGKIEATVRGAAPRYQVDGGLVIPNPMLLIAASRQ